MTKGDDVWVDFADREWPGEVIRVESSGFVLCRVHFDDPEWDFGSASACVMPEQTVAVRSCRVRPRVEAS